MGRRGPKPKPAALLRLHGSRKAERGVFEPQPESQPPEMPAEVESDSLACSTWNELCRLLGNLGLLTRTDERAMGRYCVTYSRWRALLVDVRQNGETHTVIDAMGNEVTRIRAAAKLLTELSVQLTKLEAEFGLTPSSRASIGKGRGKAGVDPMESFMAPSVTPVSVAS